MFDSSSSSLCCSLSLTFLVSLALFFPSPSLSTSRAVGGVGGWRNGFFFFFSFFLRARGADSS